MMSLSTGALLHRRLIYAINIEQFGSILLIRLVELQVKSGLQIAVGCRLSVQKISCDCCYSQEGDKMACMWQGFTDCCGHHILL